MPGHQACSCAEKTNPDPEAGADYQRRHAVLYLYYLWFPVISLTRIVVLSCGRWGNRLKARSQGHETIKCWAGIHTRMSGPKAWSRHSMSPELSPTSLTLVSIPWHLTRTWGHTLKGFQSGGGDAVAEHQASYCILSVNFKFYLFSILCSS